MQAEAALQHEGGTALGDAEENGDVDTNASSHVGPHRESDSKAAKATWQDSSAAGRVASDDEEGWEGADELDIALEHSSIADDPTAEHSTVSRGEASADTKDSGREADNKSLKEVSETSSLASLPQSGTQDDSDQQSSGQAVPLHECWAALLRRMLEHGSSLLTATVLRTIEDAAARKPFLLSVAEAHALTEAARSAGETVSICSCLYLKAYSLQCYILHVAGMPFFTLRLTWLAIMQQGMMI